MKIGFVLPTGDARMAAVCAAEAEKAGWDGFFVWEPVWGVDAWVSLTAAAMLTSRIRLGTMLSPISRMRPWDLAGKAAALDQLSGGRVTLSVGLGAVDTGFEAFGEETSRSVRAELVDEGLDILNGLWQGQPFSYQGKHYQIKETNFNPPPQPLQQPRIPIWMVGVWPSEKSMARVLRCDGLIPSAKGPDGTMGQASPAQVAEMAAWIRPRREGTAPLDVIVEGTTSALGVDGQCGLLAEWAAVGATWWIEALWDLTGSPDAAAIILERIRSGPPACT